MNKNITNILLAASHSQARGENAGRTVKTVSLTATCVVSLACLVLVSFTAAEAGDSPEWCGGPSRNNVSAEKGLIEGYEYPPLRKKGDRPDGQLPKLRNVRWTASLGSEVYGSPVVANGRVIIGGKIGSVSALWCFKESDGSLLWRYRNPWQWGQCRFGITATPIIEGDRAYVIGQLGDVLCFDVKGLADGNDGPFKEEQDLSGPKGEPFGVVINKSGGMFPPRQEVKWNLEDWKLEPNDADIVWRYELTRELDGSLSKLRGSFFNGTTGSMLIRGDLLIAATCFTAGPAAMLVVFDKNTGKLVAVNEPVQNGRGHGYHSSPSFGVVNGRECVFYGSGAGVCYAFDAKPQPGTAGEPGVLKLIWKFDLRKPRTRVENGKEIHLLDECRATPVFCKNRIYASLGGDGSGPGGRLVCIDATKTGDITESGRLWSYDIYGSDSTPVISDGLLFVADNAGDIHCLDAETGKLHWKHSIPNERVPGVGYGIWSSLLVADGKVYVPTRGNGLVILAASPQKRVISEGGKRLPRFNASPVVANGVVYVATDKYLFALQPDTQQQK